MLLISKLRPVLASVVAAAVACWPFFYAAASELLRAYGLVSPAEWGDDLFIGVNLVPLLYPIALVSSFILGQVLICMGFTEGKAFAITAFGIALVIAAVVFGAQFMSFRFSFINGIVTFFTTLALFVFSFVPAALCWWYLAVRPHNMGVNPDSSAAG
jgi:hypothetical protein